MDPTAEAEQIDDLTLMRRVAQRDEAALRALYARHSATVYGICLRIVRDAAEAEQLLIDVFAEAWDHSSRFDGLRGSPSGYLALLARSRAIDYVRSAKRRRERTAGATETPSWTQDVAVQPVDPTMTEECRSVVVAALATLDPNQRVPVELSFYEGLSHSEIAVKLDRPIGTVKTQIRQGLIRMRDALRSYWEGPRGTT